ncbi:uncharacterized protein CEXT_120211 [Caerostris extrusa]|uniref:Uncharacterized protein n=1 Tax=Caerostris extrusa TaxID=172846 RepID=A0AAV4XHI2_CAEEX|nr:uncharacterized protein CEXT_120211 [Caerostris extrusa]
MPPGAMTISMSTDDLTSAGAFHRSVRKGEIPLIRPVRADHRFSSTEDVRFRRIRERSIEKLAGNKHRESDAVTAEDYRPAMRVEVGTEGKSEELRKNVVALSFQPGLRPGLRLRQVKALGETNNNTQPQKSGEEQPISPPPSKHHPFDAEDEAEDAEEEDAGKFLMEDPSQLEMPQGTGVGTFAADGGRHGNSEQRAAVERRQEWKSPQRRLHHAREAESEGRRRRAYGDEGGAESGDDDHQTS